jgi:hypothetical protein
MADAISLIQALGLTVASKGPSGKYPRGVPGPAPGYRYWAYVHAGRYRFGAQSFPKAELSKSIRAAFGNAGFELMPNGHEAFMTLSSPLSDAVDEARAVMQQIKRILA